MTKHFAFRVDASATIGSGHVMRCLTLADSLRARGATTAFIAATLPDELVERIHAAGHTVSRIPPTAGLDPPAPGWDAAPIAPDGQREDAERFLAASAAPDWVIMDHYQLAAPWQQCVRASGRLLAVIDDLANRSHACDLLLDQTAERVRGDYRDKVPAGCTLLLGTQFALLRPEFAEIRASSLSRRRLPSAVRRLLISLGATDVGELTLPAARIALGYDGDLAVDVVVGASAPSLAALEALAGKNDRLRLHVDTQDMARLMCDADLAIGAAGATAWERCCLGLPTLTMILADNQRQVATALAVTGAAAVVPDIAALPAALALLADDPACRLAMTAASAALVDGLGTSRVADHLLSGGSRKAAAAPLIRAAVHDDMEALWLWRNDPATRRASRTPGPVPWPRHAGWFEDALIRPDRTLLIAELDGAAIGMVRFDRLCGATEGYELSINLRPDARGGGAGLAVLTAGCRHWLERHGPVRLEAEISAGNAASARIFATLGFRQVGALGADGFARYVRAEGEPLPVL